MEKAKFLTVWCIKEYRLRERETTVSLRREMTPPTQGPRGERKKELDRGKRINKLKGQKEHLLLILNIKNISKLAKKYTQANIRVRSKRKDLCRDIDFIDDIHTVYFNSIMINLNCISLKFIENLAIWPTSQNNLK